MTIADITSRLDAVLELVGAVSLLLTTLAAVLPKGWRVTLWAAKAGADLRGVVRHHHEEATKSLRPPA